ncbi:tyrosine-type recombinase/integrase family protein [Sciscionella marina]|uniref:tyrosine-type recombinase/integrase family protein n=1 Tax=Sciscionella marina TaxID=508770 RepID=UPI00196A063D
MDIHFPILDCTETTRRTYERHRRKRIEPALGKLKIAKIDASIIESFYTELRTCRDHCKRHKHIRPDKTHVYKPLGNSTILEIHGILSKAFGRAERWDWIVQNPVKKAEAPAKPEPDPQPPSPNEAARILNESWKDVSWGTLVWVAMTTSPRRGELCAPRWSDFDADRRVPTYKRSIAQDGKELWETDMKTHRKRIVALDENTTAILSDYKAHCQRMARLAGTHLRRTHIYSLVFRMGPSR